MTKRQSRWQRTAIAWGALAFVIVVAIVATAKSPLLAYRDPIYISAGFAGVIAMILLLVQPLLATGTLPGLALQSARRAHRWVGVGLLAAVVVHVAGLWITSPPDVIDALLFRSPTPFSAWGVVAMWTIFATALLAASRKRIRLRPNTWRRLHIGFAAVIAICTVIHAVLIEGTMEVLSKYVLCGLVLLAIGRVLLGLRLKQMRGQP